MCRKTSGASGTYSLSRVSLASFCTERTLGRPRQKAVMRRVIITRAAMRNRSRDSRTERVTGDERAPDSRGEKPSVNDP